MIRKGLSTLSLRALGYLNDEPPAMLLLVTLDRDDCSHRECVHLYSVLLYLVEHHLTGYT